MSDEWTDDTIIRIAHRRDFTMVANEPIEDEQLSWATLGIFVWLLSKPNGWRIDGRSIHRLGRGLGRNRVFAALSELRESGYLRTVRRRDDQGHWTTESVLYECPQCDDETPGRTESRQSGLGESAKPLVAPNPSDGDPVDRDPVDRDPVDRDVIQVRRTRTENNTHTVQRVQEDPSTAVGVGVDDRAATFEKAARAVRLALDVGSNRPSIRDPGAWRSRMRSVFEERTGRWLTEDTGAVGAMDTEALATMLLDGAQRVGERPQQWRVEQLQGEFAKHGGQPRPKPDKPTESGNNRSCDACGLTVTACPLQEPYEDCAFGGPKRPWETWPAGGPP